VTSRNMTECSKVPCSSQARVLLEFDAGGTIRAYCRDCAQLVMGLDYVDVEEVGEVHT
jgi:hypothetical protein